MKQEAQYNSNINLQEIIREPIKTKLSMIIDPAEQSPQEAVDRTRKFIDSGGSALLIGGSGFIEQERFQLTVEEVAKTTTESVPIFILPGDLGQIPMSNKNISGVFNYRKIFGSGNDFENVYPPKAREYVSKTLNDRNIPSLSTLYVLCGDPNATVSKETNILPLDFRFENVKDEFINEATYFLKNQKIDCIFFEAGSRGDKCVDKEVVFTVRQNINKYSPNTSLFVSGGIHSPEQAKLFDSNADYVNVGTHFEKNGAEDTSNFVRVLLA